MGQLTIVYEPQIDSFLDPDPEPSDEELAVEAAMGGRFQKLEDLIESEIRNWEENPDYRLKFSPSTLRRVLEFASGKRNVKTGKPKGKPGAPKLGASERSRRTPTHDGGNYYFPAIREVLRQEYPGQKPEDYRDRAYNFAARMATSLKTGMKVNDTKGKGEKVKGETLAGYRNRGRRGRGPHRI